MDLSQTGLYTNLEIDAKNESLLVLKEGKSVKLREVFFFKKNIKQKGASWLFPFGTVNFV